MAIDRTLERFTVLPGGRPDDVGDPRVAAVLQVLGGESPDAVAVRWQTDPVLLHRWTRAFVEAGTAQVLNRPEGQVAAQRDRFLAAYAHETRTPLTVARGWVSMLADDVEGHAELAEGFDRLRVALDRLAERLVDVELMSACSLGRITVRPTRVRVGELIEGLTDPTTVGGAGADVELEVEPDHVRRVLRDLWRAALLTPAPRSIRLDVVRVDPWVELRVVRAGDPVDTRVLQALFDPFDHNDDASGVTIGLYLARALVVAHGGTIGVDQDEHGAVLWVRIPQCGWTRDQDPPGAETRRNR